MKANVKMLRKRRVFTEDFKKSIVKDFESGNYSVGQLARLHQIQGVVLYRWIHKYSNFNEKGSRIVEMKDSSSEKLKALERKVKELEAIVGQKQIKIDFLEKMMDIAKEELDIDIKKNYSTPPSAGLKNTKKK